MSTGQQADAFDVGGWDFERAKRNLEPYISGSWERGSAEAQSRLRARQKNLIHMIIQRVGARLFRGFRRDVSTVEKFYEDAHSAVDFSGYAVSNRRVTYIDGGSVLSMCGMGNYRYKAALIEQILEKIRPRSVCEAGCGRLRHLVHFAPRFPEIHFSGFDISNNAIEFGRKLQSQESFDPKLPGRTHPLDVAEMERVRAISLFRANAENLAGVPDNSFELIYTISALEQMHTIAPKVLRELHRITSRYVVFCEPFVDNNDMLQRAYLWAGDYFRLPVKTLEDFGFRVLDTVVLPIKPTFTDTLVIAEKLR